MWYNQNMRLITILVLVFCIFFAHKLEARTIFTPPASYGLGNHIRVLIVPGHDDENSGAVYKEVREEDMTLMLAKEVESILENNPQISADLTRRDEGYIIELQEYFEEEKNEIEDFIQDHIEETEEIIEDKNKKKKDKKKKNLKKKKSKPIDIKMILYIKVLEISETKMLQVDKHLNKKSLLNLSPLRLYMRKNNKSLYRKRRQTTLTKINIKKKNTKKQFKRK